MKGEEQQVKQEIDQISEKVGREELDKFNKILDNITTKKMPPKEALGIGDDKIENVYAHAYQLYNSGKYTEAGYLFRLLMVLEPTEVKHYIGLAATMHMQKEFENAVRVYAIAGIVDPDNPIPYFHASDCYIQMRDKASAIIMLDMAVQKSKNKPEFQILKDRALLTIEGLKRDLLAGSQRE